MMQENNIPGEDENPEFGSEKELVDDFTDEDEMPTRGKDDFDLPLNGERELKEEDDDEPSIESLKEDIKKLDKLRTDITREKELSQAQKDELLNIIYKKKESLIERVEEFKKSLGEKTAKNYKREIDGI